MDSDNDAALVASGIPIAALCRIGGEPDLPLPAAQRRRAREFTNPQRRQQYCAGRRLLLSLCSVLAEPILAEEPPLPPAVSAHGQRFWTSVSHTGPWIACALSMNPIGIDVERRRARDFSALAERVFPSCWIDEIAASPCPDIPFYRAWTLHEALIKLGLPQGIGSEAVPEHRWIECEGWTLCLTGSGALHARLQMLL